MNRATNFCAMMKNASFSSLSARGWRAAGKAAAVTGAGSGIGRALCGALAREGAKKVFAFDINLANAEQTAEKLATLHPDLEVQASQVDVSDDGALRAAIRAAGQIDLFCANAGVATMGELSGRMDVAEWQKTWQINVMQIATAADELVPSMLEREGGAFLVTASAAGLLSQLGSAPYTASKHAAVGLAEWLAITYGGRGLVVSCVCPQGVRTPMVDGLLEGNALARAVAVDGLLEAEQVADDALACLAEGRFLCMPGRAGTHVAKKAEDRERWITGMQRLQEKLLAGK